MSGAKGLGDDELRTNSSKALQVASLFDHRNPSVEIRHRDLASLRRRQRVIAVQQTDKGRNGGMLRRLEMRIVYRGAQPLLPLRIVVIDVIDIQFAPLRT